MRSCHAAEAEKKALVARQIRTTGSSGLLGAALEMEDVLGKWVTWPFGVRCVGVFRKH